MPSPIEKETWVAGKQEGQAGSPSYRQLGSTVCVLRTTQKILCNLFLLQKLSYKLKNTVPVVGSLGRPFVGYVWRDFGQASRRHG
jgi:hypothetical protein